MAGYRKHWANCDDCSITVIVEAHPEFGPGSLPPDCPDDDGYDECEFSLFECPYCEGNLDWNSDPLTTWEETERARDIGDRVV